MFIRKADRFSRVVAFITAFAIAMLTVTLVHRTIISAEEAHPDTSESYDASDGSGESMPSESGSETSVPSDTGDDLVVTETPGDIYGDDIIDVTVPDNASEEEVPGIFDEDGVLADDSGIDLHDDTGEIRIDPNKKSYPANDIIHPQICKIFKVNADGTTKELAKGDHVNDGDPLEFDFSWSIPDKITDPNNPESGYVGFTDKYLEYDITQKLNGITLNPGTFSWWVEENGKRVVRAVYEIRREGDNTYMLIEPRVGFEANSIQRSGMIHLYGNVNLSDFDAGAKDVTLDFIEAHIDVTTSDLDNSITPIKTAVGQPVKSDVDGKYYQNYRITLKNDSIHDATGVMALDTPGSVLTGVPKDVTLYYNYDWNNKTSLTVTEGPPYTFTVNNIRGKDEYGNAGEAYIEYKMEVKAEEALSPSLSESDRKNTVTVKSDDDPEGKTAEVSMDVSSIRPNVDKSGVLDKDHNKIVWTITVHSNGMGDEEFNVKDISDLTIPPEAGYDADNGWTAKPDENGVWTKTYETELPETVTNKQVFKNKVEVTYPNGYVCDDEASVTYEYDDEFVDKECTGLGADDKIGWTATIDIPEHLDAGVTKITISDEEAGSKYNGDPVYSSLLMFDIDSMTITVDGRTMQAKEVGTFADSWNNYTGGYTFTIDNSAFLSNIVGKTIKLNYKTSIVDKYQNNPTDIDLLGLATNRVTATVEYSTGDDPLRHSDTAEYRAEFAIKKETGSTLGEVPNNSLREPLYWFVSLTDFSNVENGSQITFTDTLPEGYTFLLNDSVTTNPEYYLKCELCNRWWTPEQTINNAVSFNADYTVMNGTITINDDQANKLLNDGYFIRLTYYTQMTENFYSDFHSMDGPQSFKNTIEATVNNSTRDSEWTQIRTPKNKKVLDKKSSGQKNNDIVTYTLNVNAEGVHLGNEEADVITLTDTLGKYLSYNGDLTITPKLAGDTCSYDSDKRQLTLKLRNEQAYTISYTAKIVSILSRTEYDDKDGIDDDTRDLAIINTLYGNTAELSYEGGTPVKVSELIESDFYRSEVSIQSKLFNYDQNGNSTDGDELMCLKIKKAWNDKDNPNAVNGKIDHDESIKVDIMKFYKGGTTPINSDTVTLVINKYNDENGTYNNNDYYNIIEKLPVKDKAGRLYEYRITAEKDLPPNYVLDEVTEMQKADDGDPDVIMDNGTPLNTYVITVTNTYSNTQPKTNITVKKDWSGDNSNQKNRSASVGFVITRDGTKFKEGTLNAGNLWTASFNNLPKYSDKAQTTEYKYDVYETPENPYYKPVVTSKDNPDGKGTTFTITNKYRGETEISVTKEWKNDDDYTGLRSGSVDFTIYQDGEVYKTGKLNGTDGWTKSFKVPQYSDPDNKKPYVYTVKEDTVNKYYNSVVKPDNGKFTIENTFIPREQTTIKVTKVWKNDKGHEDLRSDSVDFSILRNDRLYKNGELNDTDGWTQTFEVLKYFDVDQSILNTYKVTEKTNNPNYISEVIPSDEEDGTTLFTITNTFDPTDITITKHWTGENDPQKTRPDSIKVTLWRDGEEYDSYEITGSKNSDTWSYTVKDLPKYDKDGSLYSYTISEEESIDGYTPTLLKNPTDGNDYQASLTNTYSDTIETLIDITVTKHWSDKGHTDKRPDNVKFDLMRNDTEYVDTYTITAGDNWEYTIYDLQKLDNDGNPYSYTVKEQKIDGYKSITTQNPTEKNVYNAVISNVYIPPETIDIAVTKNWDDKDYKYKRADVTLKLMLNGTECDRYTLLADDNIKNDVWTYTFTDLLKNDENGKAYPYTIEEEAIEGYTPDVTRISENSWSITNKYEPDSEDPNEPGSDDPNKPGSDDPNKPGSDDPNKPGSDDPNKPGSDDPNKPGSDDPNKPGSDDPNKPGSDDPNKPGSEDPNKPTPGTRPSYPPSGTTPVSPTVTEPKEPDRHEEPEDVSSEAGFFDEEFDAVRRDDLMILILAGIIVTGTLILAFRHRSDKSDGKYHM